ncbi:MAG: DnaJ domain-containing protein, partial [Flavobacteriales bacterium]|nr:DnaJ domain-containing protein [Flavobacteriales bacterium]
QADGNVDQSEVEVIRQIAGWMGISAKDSKSIEASFYTDVASHYAVLEVAESASDSEVKKAFRRMAVKFHPDKVRDMGAEYQKQARTRFDRITEAYEAIKKQRGIK